MKALSFGIALVLVSATLAPAQKAPTIRTAGITGSISGSASAAAPADTGGARARSDDDRRAEGALGRNRLAQDSVETESQARARLEERFDDSDSQEVLANDEPRVGRAAMMREDYD